MTEIYLLYRAWRGPLVLLLSLALPACGHRPEQKRATAAALTTADASAEGYREWLRGHIKTVPEACLPVAQEVHRRAWAVLTAHDAALAACLGTMQPAAPEVR